MTVVRGYFKNTGLVLGKSYLHAPLVKPSLGVHRLLDAKVPGGFFSDNNSVNTQTFIGLVNSLYFNQAWKNKFGMLIGKNHIFHIKLPLQL